MYTLRRTALAKIGAYGYPEGVEIKDSGTCAYNPDFRLFIWPNGSGLWLEGHEYSWA